MVDLINFLDSINQLINKRIQIPARKFYSKTLYATK